MGTRSVFHQQMYARSAPRLTLAALTAMALLPAGAQALTISGTNTKTLPEATPVTADQRVTDVIYYLDLQAGPTDQRFSVRLQPGSFARQGGRDEGQSVDGPLQFGLDGPGTVGQVVTDPAFATPCSDRDATFHGYATGAASVDVFLPAGAASTLAVRYKTGRRAPWADTDLRLRFAFEQRLVGTYDASSPLFGAATSVEGANTINITREVPVVSSGKGRKIGAHLILSTTPKGTYGDDGETAARKVPASQPIRVSGRLLPALSGKRVVLQWRKPGKGLRTAASVRTGSGGRFATSLRLPGKGTYELWASYPTQPGPLTSDTTSCPIRFTGR